MTRLTWVPVMPSRLAQTKGIGPQKATPLPKLDATYAQGEVQLYIHGHWGSCLPDAGHLMDLSPGLNAALVSTQIANGVAGAGTEGQPVLLCLQLAASSPSLRHLTCASLQVDSRSRHGPNP